MLTMRNRFTPIAGGCCLALALAASAQAQNAAWTAPTTPEISKIQRESLEQLANDLPQLSFYAEQNAHLPELKKGESRVVFFGDSLTEGWGMKRNGSVFFPGKPYLNRGISGQATIQMLARFRQDVIDLHPKVVVLLAGTNDLAGNMGPASPKMVSDAIQSMVDLSRANGIRVVLCSVLPATAFRWRPDAKPSESIRLLNAWLRSYAKEQKLVYVDYYSALADADGNMREGFAWDGVHPTAAGYAVMAPLVEAGIAQALKH